MAKGFYVVLEGIDGCGTTTQSRLLSEQLGRRYPGREIVHTREPSSTPVTNIIRKSLAPDGKRLSNEGLLFAFLLDRELHLRDVVQPALDRGAIVVQDRGKLSTLAYQTLKLGRDFVHSCVSNQLDPDMYVVVDVPVEEAQARMQARGVPLDMYEESLEKQRQVALNYVSAAFDMSHTATKFVQAGGLGPVEVGDRIALLVGDVLDGKED
jgi:dTMP kinase